MPSINSPDFEPSAEELRNAANDLDNLSQVPPKQRHANLATLAKTITTSAYESGLPSDILDSIIDVLTRPNHLDQVTLTSLVKNLYPASKVSSDIATRVIGSLGPGKTKPSAPTQALLVKWLILVYDNLESQRHVSHLYGVLFNHLDMISLRRPLCHLLSLITRRKHVKPFRIQALMELVRNVGDGEKELLGLVRVYKNYYPDIIVGDLTGRASWVFKHPDPEWDERLRTIHESNASRTTAVAAEHSSFSVVRRGAKRSRVDVIPEVLTSRVNEHSTTLEDVQSADDFVEKIEKIELPNQVVSALVDPLAQKFLVLNPSDLALRRMKNWLDDFFNEQIQRTRGEDNDSNIALEYVLESTLNYVRSLETLPQFVEVFLRKYLRNWTGEHERTIFGLLEYVPIRSFASLKADYFAPLELALLDNTAESKIQILQFYTALLRRWTALIRAKCQAFQVHQMTETFERVSPLTQLTSHAELLGLSILETPTASATPITSSILSFYTTLSSTYTHAPTIPSIRLTVPPASTIYHLVFTPTLLHISLLCSVLATYKSAFEASMASPSATTRTIEKAPKTPTIDPYPSDLVFRFNGYVMDLCNLLWRNRALNDSDPNALGCLIPSTLHPTLQSYLSSLKSDYNLASVFSLSHHIALAGISKACVQKLEEKESVNLGWRLEGPVTQKKLAEAKGEGGIELGWQEYRLEVLKWLERCQSDGVGRLMRSTMKNLMHGK